MQICDNYLNDGHLPPEIPRIDGRDRVPPCHPPPNTMSFNSVSQQLRLTPGCRSVPWSSRCRPPDDHLHRQPPWPSGVGGLPWRLAHLTLILSWLFVINVPSSLRYPKYHQSLVFRIFGSGISMYVVSLSILQVFKAALDSKTYIIFSCADSTRGMARTNLSRDQLSYSVNSVCRVGEVHIIIFFFFFRST